MRKLRVIEGPFERLSTLGFVRVTGVSVFERCPHTWALQFLRPQAPRRDNAASTIGTAAHSVIEATARALMGDERQFDTSSDWAKVPAEEHDALMRYNDDLLQLPIKEVLAVEHEVEFEINGVGKPIRGHVDLILRMQDGSITIVDHKTNRSAESKDYWKAQMQPLLYAYAVRRLFPDTEVVNFRIGYVNLGFPVPWVTDPAEDGPLEERMRENWADMEYYDRYSNWPMYANDSCKYCPIATDCPEHKRAHESLLKSASDAFFPMSTGEKLRYVTSVRKVAELMEKELKDKMMAEVRAEPVGRVLSGSVEYSIATGNGTRRIPAEEGIRKFIRWLSTADDYERALLMECSMDDLLTFKVGGYDKFAKKFPRLAEALGPVIEVDPASPALKARELKPSELTLGR